MLQPELAGILTLFIAVVAGLSISAFQRRARNLADVEGSVILGAGLRAWYFEQLEPFEDACVRWGVQPAHLTLAQLLASVLVAACYAQGMLFTGGWLLLCTGTLDIVDGRLARRTGSDSLRGAFLDSVVDRYADALAFLGLAIFYRDSWVLLFALGAFVGTQMISYARARGEALGIDGRVGALQRPERYVLLGFGTMFGALAEHAFGAALDAPYGLAVLVLVGLAVATNVTATRRVVHVWRQLESR